MRNRNTEIGLSTIICFDNVLRSIPDGPPKADSLATRLANLPALILDNGLVPATTFHLSKIDDVHKRALLMTLYEKIMRLCEDGDVTLTENEAEALKGDLSSEAYTSATALLLVVMTRLGLIRKVEGGDFIKVVAEELLNHLRSGLGGEDDVLEAVIEMKKVAAAFYKEKRRSGR